MKRPDLPLIYLLCILVTLLLFSTKGVPTKEELIREAVAEKLAQYREREEEKCTIKVLERAGELVDSILIARAKLQVKDIVPKPEIPFRPVRPEVKLPKDTTPVLPIITKIDTSGQE